MKIKENFSLKKFTTIKIGGPARYFAEAVSADEIQKAVELANQKQLPWYVVGAGSNLIASDTGYKGVLIKIQIANAKFLGNRVTVGAGYNLLKFIFELDRRGLQGMEKMAGIPGTVGGAIYGCAGAYGQEIKDHLASVKIWDGKKVRRLSKSQCKFGYRESIFKKKKNWVILEAVFKYHSGDPGELGEVSREIIKLRKIKYKPGLQCPGSFFKNVKLSDLKPLTKRRKFVKKIRSDKIMYGKVPSGYLLEEVGANGMREGSIRVAEHHANLIYNPNGGKAKDVRMLAALLKGKVKRKFGITLEEEIQYL